MEKLQEIIEEVDSVERISFASLKPKRKIKELRKYCNAIYANLKELRNRNKNRIKKSNKDRCRRTYTEMLS